MIALSKRAAVLPSKGQWLFEGFYNFPRNSIARDMIGTKEFRRFVPLLFTLFTMVLFYNLAGSFFLTMNPVSGKVAFPIALTLVVYVVYHWVGIKRMGLGGYFKHMIPPGLPGWIVPFVFLLELVTYLITRPLTLALRLFGNMFAGHMVIYLFVTGAFFFLLHGPNGSAKSTFVHCVMKGLEAYSETEEGALYYFSWIFPRGRDGRTIGFGSTRPSPRRASSMARPMCQPSSSGSIIKCSSL